MRGKCSPDMAATCQQQCATNFAAEVAHRLLLRRIVRSVLRCVGAGGRRVGWWWYVLLLFSINDILVLLF